MSITIETAKAHANDPAVTCCRFEEGTVVEPANLEDPAIFPDLVESGLLVLPENTLTIGQALGAKLTKTLDALTAMTPDNTEGFAAAEEEAEEEVEVVETEVVESNPVVSATTIDVSSGYLKLHIGEGKDIDLEIPLSVAASMGL